MRLSRGVSRCFGALASYPFPKKVQHCINRNYARIFALDMREFKDPCEYPTLNALFCRSLEQQRKIDAREDEIISPCDAKVMEVGNVKEGRAYQIKGSSYSVNELLGEHVDADSLEFISLYLSPKDYHRFHAPADMTIEEALYLPGAMYPVNKPSLKSITGLFLKNERVVLKCKDRRGRRFYFVAIAALNVGGIVFECLPDLLTNSKQGYFRYSVQKELRQGEELGRFLMGSSIVLLWEDVEFCYSKDSVVKYGQILAKERA